MGSNKNQQQSQQPPKRSMLEELKSISEFLYEKWQKTQSDTWRVSYLCISQGIEKIKAAKSEDAQRAENLKDMGEQIRDINEKG